MTLRRRTEILAHASRPLSAREKRHALRLSRRAKVVRWIGASKNRRMAAAPNASKTPAGPPAELIVLSWSQLFGRNIGSGSASAHTLDGALPQRDGSKLLAFRAN